MDTRSVFGMLSDFGMDTCSGFGMDRVDWFDRFVIKFGDACRRARPVVAHGSVVVATIDKPTGVHCSIPGCSQLLGAVETENLHQLRIPKSHWALVACGVFGVSDVDDQADSLVPDVLGGAALEQQSCELVGVMR